MQSYPQDIAHAIGTAVEGGTFGGIINVNGTRKGVIWAPKSAGQIVAVMLQGSVIHGARSPCDCAANMISLLAAGSPAAQLVAAMDINGFNDWVIPSRDVLELGYRHFKPGTRENYCSWRDGENPNSVPAGWLYSSDNPTQTDNKLFKSGGDKAFDEGGYFSSTVMPDGDTAFVQNFNDGPQYDLNLFAELRVRAVRLIQLVS